MSREAVTQKRTYESGAKKRRLAEERRQALKASIAQHCRGPPRSFQNDRQDAQAVLRALAISTLQCFCIDIFIYIYIYIKDAPRRTAAPAQSQPRAEVSHAFCPAGWRTRAGGYGPPPYRSREESRRGSTSSGNLGRRWPSLGLCPPSAWAFCGSCSPWRVVVPSSQVLCYIQASTEKRERKDNSHSDAFVFGSHTPCG